LFSVRLLGLQVDTPKSQLDIQNFTVERRILEIEFCKSTDMLQHQLTGSNSLIEWLQKLVSENQR